MDPISKFFLILLIFFAFFFPILQRRLLKRHQKVSPPPIPTPKEEMKPKKIEVPVVTERQLKEGEYEFHSKYEDFKPKNLIEERQFKTRIQPKFKDSVTSRAFYSKATTTTKTKNLKKLTRRQKMVIHHEVLKRYELF